MLLAAAVLILLVGLMHSVVGGRRLIAPILRLESLPVILGDVALSRLTLRAGWHALTAVYWAMAALLVYMHFEPGSLSRPFLWMSAAVFAATGLVALFLSKGRHLSWLLFLPAAALIAAAA